MKRHKSIALARFLSLATIAILLLLTVSAQAQTPDSSVVDSRKAQLQAELDQLEVKIDQQKAILTSKQQGRVSLERDVAILDAKIKTAELSIRARTIAIQQLSSGIAEKELTITGLGDKLSRAKQSLAQLLRKTNDIDTYPYIVVILGNGDLSSLFQDIETFTDVQKALRVSFVEIIDTKAVTESQKNALEEERSEQVQLQQLQVLEEKKIQSQKEEKKQILKITKGEEKAYQTLIQKNEKSAAQIRSELFTLRGSTAIPFGKALDLANTASKVTNVRPAFILGVIAEESNLGENVGTGSWQVDMHPTRDRPIFVQIMQRLGFDPDKMPVSKKPWYGWGGAMGPAQFIPSTWVLYEERIAKVTGHTPPNPYDPGDAFMASAILLADNGADRGTRAAERLAALRYFAGWVNATKKSYAFYGDDVMELADKYQRQIDVLLATGALPEVSVVR